MERQFAILAYDCADEKILDALVSSLKKYVLNSKINVFFNSQKNDIHKNFDLAPVVYIPTEFNTEPKIRNYVNQQYKNAGFRGFLHVIKWSTNILKDPSAFVESLEDMMDKLDYNVWFNTVCDKCNYVYHKYSPRAYIKLDDLQFKLLKTNSLAVTSHSNTQWIAYNFAKATDSELHFDEDFTIPMYFIIEFLARRKANKTVDQLYFMNQYFTVDEEHGVFSAAIDDATVDQQLLKNENEVFSSKHVIHAPDNNVDIVATQLYLKVKSQLS